MKCSKCQFENPAGMKFCGECGAKLAALCPQCGTENPPGFKFCGECGSPLGASKTEALPPPPPAEASPPALSARSYTPPHLAAQVLQSKSALEGERKQVTVLFCDLVGSTSLAERLGPETMHLLLNRFFELALSEVHRYEGTINQFLGDGFMALFGAPIAHEDHARRAALAALGLQKLLAEHHAELGERGGVELRFRMGINTGWVVVGGIGDQLRRDYTAIGDTTNLAARLQQLAAPGAILVSEDTSRFLQGSARLEPMPPLQVKGKEAPVRAFRLLGVGLLQSEDAVLGSTARSPFVGRRREMAILEELRERAAAGEGQVVGIAAEAGSGKSRLIYEFRRRLWDRPVLRLAGRCLSYTSGVPYVPILYMLRNAWEIGESDDAAAVTAKVVAGLRRAEMEVAEALPCLLHLLGVREGTEVIAELSPQALQTRTFRLLRQMILNESRHRLVVLEIEDLHWVDRTSEEFLSLLVEGLFAAHVLLIATYRSGYRSPWIEKSNATQIPLSRLTDAESEAVVRAVLRRAELPEKLVAEVRGKAEGNPFFLEELARSLLEHPGVSVPDTIQGVLMARIDRLPDEHKRLLQTASVLGREFPLNLLAPVWEQTGDLTALLSDLKRWEFLYEEPTAEEPRYLFKHALTQEAVYQTLLTGRRRTLHGAAGQAFESLFAGRLEDVYDRLAYHYSEAGIPEKAVSYLALLAEKAARGYAHAEAAKALREALSHAERLPDSERDRRSLELIDQLASSLLPLACFSETLEVLFAHQGAMDRLGDPALAGRYHFWLAHTYSYLGDQIEAESNAQRAISAAREAGDTLTEGQAWYVLGRDAFWSGRFSEGIQHGRQAVALLKRSADRWWQGQAYWVAGFHHYVLGQFEDALEMMACAHEIWEALQDPRLDPSWSTGYFHASLGDWDLGIEECKGGLQRARDPLNTAAAQGFLGYAYLEKRDLPRAIEALEGSVEQLRQAGMLQLYGWFSAFLAEARLLSGLPAQRARETALEALSASESSNFPYGLGIAQRTLGRVARAAGDREEAEKWLREALESFRALEAPFEVARTRLDLALLAGAGSETAAGQLGEARRMFAELGVPVYVERTDRLAGELAAAR
ncbi:MAG TPA: adenylate/guanylate cyclase domain-containing protein [Thermoanaerobaculia bacterium]|jgi:class 3 adenylate cyclase/tetratricopeptide (TPR) repeat protein|nr:adenylate/guanylate cyclase domain-containing protein [Thermoanaerobaculia bacterium]